MKAPRTYWHLQARGRVPTDYEIVGTGLLYYQGRGFGVRTPVAEWIERHQRRDRLRCDDWDRFEDPRATTYATYTELQHQRAIFVEGVFDAAARSEHDTRLSPQWIECVRTLLAPLRYPAHALQMASAYVGSMAPAGRVTVALAFQSADAARMVQSLAYRLAVLRTRHQDLTHAARRSWEVSDEWQPWRRVMERLLVAYDFDEALLALNLVVKPVFDEVFLTCFGQVARKFDGATHQLLSSLNEDSAWQRDCTAALLRMLADADPHNLERAAELATPWLHPTLDAASASLARLATLLGEPAVSPGQLRAALGAYWTNVGLQGAAQRWEAES